MGITVGGVNRLPAEVSGEFTRCCICLQLTRAIHWHHTIPRSLGGEDGLQIPLDGDCHTALHSKADAVVSMIRNPGKKHKLGQYWSKSDDEQRAETWLRILVDSMLTPPVSGDNLPVLLPQRRVSKSIRFALDLLKRDLPGVTNLGQVLEYCIIFTLKSKGLYNETLEQDRNQATGRLRGKLW
jgi:hypothetical protein